MNIYIYIYICIYIYILYILKSTRAVCSQHAKARFEESIISSLNLTSRHDWQKNRCFKPTPRTGLPHTTLIPYRIRLVVQRPGSLLPMLQRKKRQSRCRIHAKRVRSKSGSHHAVQPKYLLPFKKKIEFNGIKGLISEYHPKFSSEK